MVKLIKILFWAFIFLAFSSLAFATEQAETVLTLADRMKFFGILVPAAVGDSINPCAFAVMFILLSSILRQQKSRTTVLFAWFLFTLAVFISYVAMWLWLYKVVSSFTAVFYVKLVVWILWILIWLANLKDYFWYWKYFKFEVPDAWRPKMNSILKKVVSPIGAFFVWFLISLFLLPCSSWPYIVVLWYLASESATINMWWYIYIIIYNIIFILPMLAIALVVAFGKKISELKEYKELHVEKLHLITWVIMLLLWLYILYDIFRIYL